MITQSFLYNAIFFTYTLVLAQVLRRAAAKTAPLYLIAFAVGNLLGPLRSAASSTPSAARR